ncbi:class II aldolase/adducin family protein [Pigmentiphaga litoralis]|uniref:Ribulose-5-phosphate 4-epimerase/fuculose-1-phosphate aldolase n=1 Tax=Pigmentiphaga litoralis TaxID=516702 RepID=A0A7Y9IV70_9BURK|nr:class II aldolase/adducin family protein [Pigmentiphaga litoralis]NYE22719.1 ribulose-5-phosphate 4-epimerase/fuculose-1-phosphate aldolase [Pigmentiphaga litoralis]NYE83666.1 ribulose-5-phosphate 4-epimerase/fuculose-1-phosphate aldolase [Pigmentiphaga litoralis]
MTSPLTSSTIPSIKPLSARPSVVSPAPRSGSTYPSAARALSTSAGASSLREQVSDAEWQARVDLAACYRLAVQFRWTDHIYTHFSARVPGDADHFLINPFGYTFDEVTASNLVKVDLDGNIVTDIAGVGINNAGYIIHSAIHAGKPEYTCVLHTHTPAGIAVSAQRDGLLMLSQHAARFFNRVAYHDYEGFAVDVDERQRLVADLGDHRVMVLRNHGLLAAGTSIPEAFQELHFIERACAAQLAAQSAGVPLLIIPDTQAEEAAQFIEGSRHSGRIERHWNALIRQLDRETTAYRD